jgi:hypothetical protein
MSSLIVWTIMLSFVDEKKKLFLTERQRIFPLASLSRPALSPTQPPIRWVPEVLSPGVKHGRGVPLTTHPHLVPRSRMSSLFTPYRLYDEERDSLTYALRRPSTSQCVGLLVTSMILYSSYLLVLKLFFFSYLLVLKLFFFFPNKA